MSSCSTPIFLPARSSAWAPTPAKTSRSWPNRASTSTRTTRPTPRPPSAGPRRNGPRRPSSTRSWSARRRPKTASPAPTTCAAAAAPSTRRPSLAFRSTPTSRAATTSTTCLTFAAMASTRGSTTSGASARWCPRRPPRPHRFLCRTSTAGSTSTASSMCSTPVATCAPLRSSRSCPTRRRGFPRASRSASCTPRCAASWQGRAAAITCASLPRAGERPISSRARTPRATSVFRWPGRASSPPFGTTASCRRPSCARARSADAPPLARSPLRPPSRFRALR